MNRKLTGFAAASAVMLLLTALPARAQLSSTITTVIHDSTFSLGRDFWFAEQSNYWGQNLGGKYILFYVTSPKNMTAFVQYGGVITPIPVLANHISTYKPPLSWEMESSGIIENKTIHVWSYDADIEVYNMSHQPYSSDGE